MDMVTAVNLKKYYSTDTYEVRALDGVSLTAEEGEFLAVVGTSGSGKTTLLNMLGGLDVPDSGRGLDPGEQPERHGPGGAYRISETEYSGFVFQQYNLIPSLSVYENIVLPLRLDGQGVDEGLFEEITHLLGLADKLDRLPGTLSGGQQQRTAIARAMLPRPAVLLADEFTGSLDSVTGMEVTGLLRSCASRFRQTVIAVTHQEAVAQMADRIIRISDGRICSDGRDAGQEG